MYGGYLGGRAYTHVFHYLAETLLTTRTSPRGRSIVPTGPIAGGQSVLRGGGGGAPGVATITRAVQVLCWVRTALTILYFVATFASIAILSPTSHHYFKHYVYKRCIQFPADTGFKRRWRVPCPYFSSVVFVFRTLSALFLAGSRYYEPLSTL